jgi:hypothetical protein
MNLALVLWLLGQQPATACDRATALTIRIVRDNTALMLNGDPQNKVVRSIMTLEQRRAVEKELKEASKACKEVK